MSEIRRGIERGSKLEYEENHEQFLILPDGRKMAYKNCGRETDYPIFFLHGTPGGKDGPLPRSLSLRLANVRLIVPDRSGYGGSDRDPGRSISSIAEDVAFLADSLGIDRFSVAGRSGGAPHALACAALLRDRVQSALALVSIAPPDAQGLDWYAGMGPGNVAEYELVDSFLQGSLSAARTIDTLRANTTDAMRSGNFIDIELQSQLPIPDRRVIGDAAIRSALNIGFENAAANMGNLIMPSGPVDSSRAYVSGQYDDHIAFRTPWGFDPADITCPTLLWHGEKDIFSPFSHSEWLQERIPSSILDTAPEQAHFGAIEVFPFLLTWARTNAMTR